MKRPIAALLCLLPTLASQNAGATNYHEYRKFEAVSHDNKLKRVAIIGALPHIWTLRRISRRIAKEAWSREFSARLRSLAGSIRTRKAVRAFKAAAGRASGHRKAKCAGGPIRNRERTGARSCGNRQVAEDATDTFGTLQEIPGPRERCRGRGQPRVHHRSEGQCREQPGREVLWIKRSGRRGARHDQARRAAPSAATGGRRRRSDTRPPYPLRSR